MEMEREEEAPAAVGGGVMGVAKRPEAVGEMPVEVTGAAGKEEGAAAVNGMATASEEEGKAKAAVGKKTKLVRVKQEFIDGLLARPRKPFKGISAEFMDKIPDPKLRKSLQASMARTAALMKKLRDEEEDILEQYRTKGFAMEEIEIEGDEDMAVEA
ncbi:hypothetical protein ACP70R_025516 [Stipagrostis hirtigluma subsp. patula]